MAYDPVMDALGDPTRRAILGLLRTGPRSVGDIAGYLPVSRPAVSQHLKILRGAGLVQHRSQGTRRLYGLDLRGLELLRGYLDSFWDQALDSFKDFAEEGNDEMIETRTEPLRKEIVVGIDRDRAFELFTDGIGRWWPAASHSVHEDPGGTVVMEGREGGRIYERSSDDAESEWGRVRVWDPPHRIVFSWYPGRSPSEETEVEVRFEIQNGATRLTLEHRGWERLGDKAGDRRSSYDSGWPLVLERFAAEAGGSR